MSSEQVGKNFRRPRESGDPAALVKKTLDSRFRGNDNLLIAREIVKQRATRRFRHFVERKRVGRMIDADGKSASAA